MNKWLLQPEMMNFNDDFVDFDALLKKIRKANAEFARQKALKSYEERFAQDFFSKYAEFDDENLNKVKINIIQVYRVKPHLNIVMNVLDKNELEETVKKQSDLSFRERLFTSLLAEEETIVNVLNDARDLIDKEIEFTIKTRLDALDKLIPYFKSKFDRNLLINIKSLKNPPKNIVKTLNLFFTMFSFDSKNLIDTGLLNK
jgi:hypothetical protein